MSNENDDQAKVELEDTVANVALLSSRHVAKIIAAWRKKGKLLTRENLASKLGVSVSTIVRWERPSSNPRISEICAMERAKPGLIRALFNMGVPSTQKKGRKMVALKPAAKVVEQATEKAKVKPIEAQVKPASSNLPNDQEVIAKFIAGLSMSPQELAARISGMRNPPDDVA